MMFKLILRDRAVRLLGPWLLLGALIGFMLASNQQDAIRHGLTVGIHGFQGFRYIAYIPWGVLALHLLYARVDTRCDRFDMTLPIPQRTLWLSRVLALTLSQWVLIGTAVATLLLRNRFEGLQVIGRTRVESLFAQLAAASILVVLLARLPRPSLFKLPFSPGYALYLALAWAGTLGVIFVLAGEPPIYALVPSAIALALGLWVYLSLPESFVLVPREPEGQKFPPAGPRIARETEAGETIALSERGSRWLLHTTIWRTCYGHWASWLAFALLLALGFGAARPEPANSLNGFWLFVFYWLILGALFGGAVSRLHMLDPLPVSRKLIFAYVIIPGLLVASLGCFGARLIRANRAGHSSLVDYREHPVVHKLDIQVPLEFWEIGWGGHPLPVEEPYVAPWEEAYFPWSVSLFRGLPIVLYSPYHVPDGSSPEGDHLAHRPALAAVPGPGRARWLCQPYGFPQTLGILCARGPVSPVHVCKPLVVQRGLYKGMEDHGLYHDPGAQAVCLAAQQHDRPVGNCLLAARWRLLVDANQVRADRNAGSDF